MNSNAYMKESELECEGCPHRLERLVGNLKCGLKQGEFHGNKMCLTAHPVTGLYWINHKVRTLSRESRREGNS